MIEQSDGAMEQGDGGQRAIGKASQLSERLHWLAAYAALAMIAGIVFGMGTAPL